MKATLNSCRTQRVMRNLRHWEVGRWAPYFPDAACIPSPKARARVLTVRSQWLARQQWATHHSWYTFRLPTPSLGWQTTGLGGGCLVEATLLAVMMKEWGRGHLLEREKTLTQKCWQWHGDEMPVLAGSMCVCVMTMVAHFLIGWRHWHKAAKALPLAKCRWWDASLCWLCACVCTHFLIGWGCWQNSKSIATGIVEMRCQSLLVLCVNVWWWHILPLWVRTSAQSSKVVATGIVKKTIHQCLPAPCQRVFDDVGLLPKWVKTPTQMSACVASGMMKNKCQSLMMWWSIPWALGSHVKRCRVQKWRPLVVVCPWSPRWWMVRCVGMPSHVPWWKGCRGGRREEGDAAWKMGSGWLQGQPLVTTHWCTVQAGVPVQPLAQICNDTFTQGIDWGCSKHTFTRWRKNAKRRT